MRYGEFVAQHKIRHTELSYNLLTPKPDPSGTKSLRPEKNQSYCIEGRSPSWALL